MFAEHYKHYLSLIEDYLEKLPWHDDVLSESMYYTLAGGGKRIRPVLTLACAEITGGNPSDYLPAAAALEVIHTYSLIHDDLPAMDNDDYRRGKLSNHKVFGEGKAILAGDALLTYAFELLAQPLKVSPEKQLTAIYEVAAAAGRKGMVGGQVADLDGEGKKLSLVEVENIHKAKTGALLVAAARLGAILAGGTLEQINALTNYAKAVGLAFQIKDDILDVEGDSQALGKPVGSDKRRDKATYVSLLGLSGAKEHLQEQTEQAHQALNLFGDRALFLHELASYIAERKS